MGELLFAGVTHYPPLNRPDPEMAGLLRFALEDPSIPDEQKDPDAWPEGMRLEWSDHDASAARHRAAARRELPSRARRRSTTSGRTSSCSGATTSTRTSRRTWFRRTASLCYPDTVTYPWRNKRAFGSSPLDEQPAD